MKKDSNSNPMATWTPVLIEPPGASEPIKVWTAFLNKMEKAVDHPESAGFYQNAAKHAKNVIEMNKNPPALDVDPNSAVGRFLRSGKKIDLTRSKKRKEPPPT